MKHSDICIGFVPIARPTFDMDLARELTARVYARVCAAQYEVVGSQDLVMDGDAIEARIAQLAAADVDMVLLLQASFADSTMVLQLAQALEAPLLLWALPEAQVGGRLRINSFCGINLAGHGLRRAGIRYDYIYAEPEDRAALEELHNFAVAAGVKRRLQETRIGRLGEHPAGFDTCRVNHVALKSQLGVEVAQFELAPFFDRARAADAAKVAVVDADLAERLANYQDMEPDSTKGTLSVYVALDELVREENLSAMALRCWPEFFTDLGCSACGAMSLLSDEMTPSSCEADVNGTITQLILGWISGEPAFGSDIVAFDIEADEATLWHCGLAPLSMADPDVQPEATIHSNREKPLLMQFPLKPGRVTIARLSEATGEFRLVIGGGEMLKAPPAFSGTSGRIRFDSGAESVMDVIMREGLEHHVSIAYGDHQAVLRALARQVAMPVLGL
ncbi:MAG: L-fucose/L-arabinose isomerase family protein [Chloroflexi bacterium]|nr:L-fucose/L-arabinose isomerase family protein [Chloroflexota bacterium]